MDTIKKTFGKLIWQHRKKQNLPLSKVVAFFEIDTSTLIKFEKNLRHINCEHITKLAELFALDEHELLVLYLSGRINKHLINRLFDRDTLILQAYNINFLFVVAAYIQSSSTQKEQFKKNTRTFFRSKLIAYLNKNFEFKKIISDDIEQFVEQNFRKLQGKIYRPSGWENELLLAVENGTSVFEDFENCKIESYDLSI